MVTWQQFCASSSTVAATFRRRHEANGKLCLLGTVRADGSPRISPIEPRVAAGQLCIAGMPGTRKLRDLERDPRFTLHTATVDSHVADGDAKVWGEAVPIRDRALARAFAEALFADAGIDIRSEAADGPVPQVLVADIHGASSVEPDSGRLVVHAWNPTTGECVAREL